jgi:hypothetical protein
MHREQGKRSDNKGKLIRGYLERVSSEAFTVTREQVRRCLKGKSGLYALYLDDEFYYVGMTSDLFYRIDHHREDRHRRKWNRFSAYVIQRFRYIKDLEALHLRLLEGPGNRQTGRFPRRFNLKKSMKEEIDLLRGRIDTLFGRG